MSIDHAPNTALEAPRLSLVKDDSNITTEATGRPAWIASGTALAKRAADTRALTYAGWTVAGYRELGRRWLEARHDEYPASIRSVKLALRATRDIEEQDRLRRMLKARRAAYRRHRRIFAAKTAGWLTVLGGGGAITAASGLWWVDFLAGAGTVGIAARHGRPEPELEPQDTGQPLEEAPAMLPAAVERAFDAPPPPALTVDELVTALREIGMVRGNEQIIVLAAPERGKDGNTTAVFDLPPRVTVAMLQKKLGELAGALGRDASMVDVVKAGTERRVSLWMADVAPFDAARPSPLLMRKGGIDAWRDGVPVAWAKRGNAVHLPIMNSNFLIGGMTRSGKGVGAANLAAGSSLDVRINLRIVAGKNNGEWDPYAKAGVAATYFKPNARRLLALLEALKADKDRREAELGKLGKSKLVPEAINRLGGIELLVIDELATYTRPGKPLRDEILEGLIELSAVAAGAGILMGLITQYPEVDVIPQGLAMNCGTRWAMRVDNATQSNAILGGGQASSGRDASKFDPPIPGLGWLVNPFAGVTDLARSFDLDEDERGEVTKLLTRAAELRKAAGRLAGQWEDPIEQHLLNTTGLSSAAGGPEHNGIPGRAVLHLSSEQRQQLDAVRGALAAMGQLGRDAAQTDEMAEIIGGGMAAERLGELLRAAGAGGTVKVTIEGRGRVNGYRRADIVSALKYLEGA